VNFQRVLCAVDFTEFSRRALHHARAIATWYEADLHVLHAFQGNLPVNMPALAALPATSSADFRPATESALETLVVSNQAGPATRVVRDGHAAATIVAYAREIGADLLVLGSHGWSGFDRLMLGSTAETVLHRADCPVLTVPCRADEPGAADRFKLTHVLCPVDFSPASLDALALGLSLAQENAARVTVLHVSELPADDALLVEGSLPLSEYLELRARQAIEELSAFIPASARDWCEIRTLVRNGRPAAAILSEAEAGHVDLIVMGSQGRHGVGLALFGSTTQTVVRRATCPVLTARISRGEREPARVAAHQRVTSAMPS
jgi:nucleotide-binding universal stress UspA family protein